ncbi:ATP-binding protein [Candidatus Pacearchaeota archaeon]|nr:ATP-binding protein [Candidatus Pacearchaeota archaeon]
MENKSINYLIIRGALGIGKSTVSKKLANVLDARHISYDELIDVHPYLLDHKEDGYISQKSFFIANNMALDRARKDLEKRRLVIFDGNFYWKSTLDDFVLKMHDLGYSGQIFTLTAPLDVCMGRDAAREKPYGPEAAKAVYKKANSFESGVEVDTTNINEDDVVNYIIKNLKRGQNEASNCFAIKKR